MRRAIVPLALILALVTGVVLHATSVVVLVPAMAPPLESKARSNAALVQGFYHAVNETLATGNASGLDAVLDPDFVDHAAPFGLPLGRDEFVQSLLSLRSVAPSLRLDVRDVVVQSDRVAATIAVAGAEGATFLGLPVSATTLWGATNLFRVEAGQIAERWGDPAGLASYTSLLSVGVSIDEPTEQSLTLERWTYAPGAAETRAGDPGIVVLLCESGSLAVQVTAGAYDADANGVGRFGPVGRRPSASPVSTEVLRPGDAVVVSNEDRIDIRNDGIVPAMVLAIRASGPAPAKGSVMESIGPPTRIERTVLAAGPTRVLPVGEARVEIGRVSLAPGAGLPLHPVVGAELATVETGALVLSDGGRASVVSRPNALPRYSHEGPIVAGGGVSIDAGTVVAYHNAGEDQLVLSMAVIIPTPADPATTSEFSLVNRST